MYSQLDMFQPVFGGLNKIIEEAVPRYLDHTLETGVLLLIDHLYKKTSLVVPEKKFNYCT
jgi:hypothetical protein